jgi:hypothetical protein
MEIMKDGIDLTGYEPNFSVGLATTELLLI